MYITRAKPYKRSCGIGVDILHQRNLAGLFIVIFLVDADRIDPDRNGPEAIPDSY
jgi:hypothetical protein